MRKEKLFYAFFIVLICYDTKTFFLHDMNGKKLISINSRYGNLTHIIYLLSRSTTCQLFDVDLSLLKQENNVKCIDNIITRVVLQSICIQMQRKIYSSTKSLIF